MNGVGDESMKRYGNLSDRIDYLELDLPIVINQKEGLFARFRNRRKRFLLPRLLEVDLNELTSVQSALESIFSPTEEGKPLRYKKIIIIAEAVLMYLNRDAIAPMLKTAIDSSKKHSGAVAVVFSDRIPGVCEKLDNISGYGVKDIQSHVGIHNNGSLERSLFLIFTIH